MRYSCPDIRVTSFFAEQLAMSDEITARYIKTENSNCLRVFLCSQYSRLGVVIHFVYNNSESANVMQMPFNEIYEQTEPFRQ